MMVQIGPKQAANLKKLYSCVRLKIPVLMLISKFFLTQYLCFCPPN